MAQTPDLHADMEDSTDIITPRFLQPKMVAYLLVLVALFGFGLYAFAHYEQAILGWMQQNQQWLSDDIKANPVSGALIYITVFALAIGFYIPGGVVLLLMAGALFPFWEANLYANIGNMIGATIGFLLSRYLLRDEVQACYGKRLRTVNDGIRQHGWIYLLILRIAPVLPSPVVNLGMGLTPINLWLYMAVTLLGRIPMTALYVNLGMQLSEIDRLSDLLSFNIMATLVAVCVLMLAGHWFLQRCRIRRAQGKSC